MQTFIMIDYLLILNSISINDFFKKNTTILHELRNLMVL